VVEPFTSKVSGLRGAVVRLGRKRCSLLDPIAMLGLSCNLKTFISVFAPDYPKGDLDFETTAFDPTNSRHVAYALRDSEALYHAMLVARTTLGDLSRQPLRATVGAVAIRTLACNLPGGVRVPVLPPNVYDITRRIVMRGGYVFARRYRGKLWTYDLNQAYAHALRSCALPAGRARPQRTYTNATPGIWHGVLSRAEPSLVPYMVRACAPPYKIQETFGGVPCVTWLTTDEVECLRRHGWAFEVRSGYAFADSFNCETFVTDLETHRRNYPKDHPVNVLCKAIGCNAYGKTLQEQVTMKVVVSAKRPKGGFPMVEADADGNPIWGLWYVPETRDTRRNYERPQIGAFVTAFVRTIVFDAIMRDPSHFVKADTDSVSFTRAQRLPISPWRYGAWKVEARGAFHIVIGKKVYWCADKTTAKGLRVRELDRAAFERWHAGQEPVQSQTQLQSFKKGTLAPSWEVRTRRGTRIDTTPQGRLV
jgi:hypothetical protein